MKYLTLVILSLVLTACKSGGSAHDDFHVHLDIAEDSDIAASGGLSEVSISKATHSGAGCPANTGDVTISDDKKTLSILFDEYQAEAGLGTGPAGGAALTTSRVTCNLSVSLKIPAGYRAFLIGADFRGAVSLPEDAIAEFNREYFFASESSPMLTATWSGEVENDSIEISDDLYANVHNNHSRCGEDVILRSNTSLYIAAPADADTALIQMDSLDYQNQQANPRFDYQLSYEKCT